MWTGFDTWIAVVSALSAMSCAVLGNFLVLRRMSMMGDAISHTVLPGIAIAFLLTASRESLPMLLGAAGIGLLTVFLVQAVHRLGELDEGASMGVVFTSLFAVGLILIRQGADKVDLDPGCVLYGAVEFAPLDVYIIGGLDIPRAAVVNGAFLLINLAFVLLFYKELKVTAFDPAFADSIGINSRWVHYGFMTLVAATVVASFETVGSILVIAMLIIPAACGYLLTNRLSVMIGLSLVFGLASGFLGHGMALWVPEWLGLPETSTAGMVGVAALLLFTVVALVSPRHGILSRAGSRLALSMRVLCDDVLGFLYRRGEPAGEAPPIAQRGELADRLFTTRPRLAAALAALRLRGLVERRRQGYLLTEAGAEAARALIRSHRLWETYMVEEMGLRPDHVHGSAERLEHITSREMRERLEEKTASPRRDPHASEIPPE